MPPVHIFGFCRGHASLLVPTSNHLHPRRPAGKAHCQGSPLAPSGEAPKAQRAAELLGASCCRTSCYCYWAGQTRPVAGLPLLSRQDRSRSAAPLNNTRPSHAGLFVSRSFFCSSLAVVDLLVVRPAHQLPGTPRALCPCCRLHHAVTHSSAAHRLPLGAPRAHMHVMLLLTGKKKESLAARAIVRQLPMTLQCVSEETLHHSPGSPHVAVLSNLPVGSRAYLQR